MSNNMKPTCIIDIETIPPSISCLPEISGDRDPATFGATSIFMAEIVCVGVHVIGEQPRAFVNRGVIPGEHNAIEGDNWESEIEVHIDEENLLWAVNEMFKDVHRFSGWNIRGFDLPLLHNRMIRHGIRPCNALVMACKEPRYYPDKCFDLMDLTTFFARRASLREAAIGLLGKDPKANGNGADVAGLVREGKVEELVRYCLGDVEITREIYERWVG